MRPASPAAPGVPVPRDRRRALGALGEDMAVGHFRRLGFVMVGRNVRTRRGEIDLIAFDGHTLVFVEVKTKRASGGRQGSHPREQPLAWLSTRQRQRLRNLACAWLHEGTRPRPSAKNIRFDAVGVTVDSANQLLRLDHIEGAW
jgi:putative endonuclease